MNIDFQAESNAIRDDLVAWRRDFHRHPELAFEEVRTAGIVADELNKLGLEVQTGIGKTGVVAILEGATDGPTVLWRADMDALPVEEANEVEYVSTVPGKMHACGHDGHTAIGLGIARLLTKHRDQLRGRVKFVFQPAEEIVAGAQAMIADGALGDPRPAVSLGLHLWNSRPLGEIGVTDGPIMAGSSVFDIVIEGRGGHAASPHLSVDPVICAAHIIQAMQSIVSRNVSPLDNAVLTVTKMQAADAYNIIPDRVSLSGTFRTFSMEVRDLIEQRINEIGSNLSVAMGCKAEVDVRHGTIPTINDAQVAETVRQTITRVLPNIELFIDEHTMGSEDMAFFMDDIAGTYIMLGSNNVERELNYPHHHPRFDFDEDALPLGVAVGAAMLVEHLANG